MTGIKDWSITAADNNAASPNGWKEGIFPSDVNNIGRQMMADIREAFEDGQWFNYGSALTYLTGTTFNISGDVTALYTANRRIKVADASTLYGAIVSSNYSAPNTTITVVLDTGSLSASLSGISLGALTATNSAIPAAINSNVTGDINVSAHTLTLADNQISGDKIDAGTISNFASTGIDDNAVGIALTIDASNHITVGNNFTVNGTSTFSDDVSLSANADPKVSVTDSDNSITAILKANGTNTCADVGTTTNHPLHLVTNNTDRMTVGNSGDIEVNGQIYTAEVSIGEAAALSWNMNVSQTATVTLTASRTFNAPTNLKAGAWYTLRIVQGGTGSYSITAWNAVFKWTNDVNPSLSTAVGDVDVFLLYSDGTNLYGTAG